MESKKMFMGLSMTEHDNGEDENYLPTMRR